MNTYTLQRLIDGHPLLGYREGGNSMAPLIRSRQPVDVDPIGDRVVRKGDIVVARVHGRVYTHLVHAVDGDRVLIGNNHGHMNGWTSRDKVYGVVVAVDGAPVGKRSSAPKV